MQRARREQAGASGPVPGQGPGEAVDTWLGDYHLIEYLGRGGMADVYAALGPGIDGKSTAVAVKRFLVRDAPERRLLELFIHEAELATRLIHPNVVSGIDFGVHDGVPFLVLELVDGVTCDTLRRRGGGQLPPRLAMFVIDQVLRGLTFVHEARDELGRALRVVHNDITPDNILIGALGEVKISDFGVARSALEPAIAGKRLRGKLGYMAPEQVAGLATDARSDLFSLGVVMADLLLGRRLFEQGTELELLTRAYECTLDDALAELEPRVRQSTGDVLTRLLAREPGARFQSAREAQAAASEAAQRLGPAATDSELALWLLEHDLIRRAESEPRPSQRAADVAGKIRLAPAQVVTSIPDGARAPKPGLLPRTNDAAAFFLVEPDSAVVQRLTLTELVERVVTGRVSRDAMTSQDGQPFVPLHSLSVLNLVMRASAYRFHDDDESRVRWTTRLVRTQLPSVVFDLALARATGVLVLSTGRQRKRVFFEEGSPCFVASTNRTELFGRRLAAQRLLRKDQIEHAVALAVRQGRRLGEILVDNRLATAGVVLRSLIAQMEDRVLEIGTWREGEVHFLHDVHPGPKAPPPFGCAAALPCNLIRHCYSDREIAELFAMVGRDPMSATGAPHFDALPLTDGERSILDHVRRCPDPGELVEHLSEARLATPAQTRRALFLGLSSSALVSPSWKPASGPTRAFGEGLQPSGPRVAG